MKRKKKHNLEAKIGGILVMIGMFSVGGLISFLYFALYHYFYPCELGLIIFFAGGLSSVICMILTIILCKNNKKSEK